MNHTLECLVPLLTIKEDQMITLDVNACILHIRHLHQYNETHSYCPDIQRRLMQIYLSVVQETSYVRRVTFDKRSVITRQANMVLM